MKKQETLEEAMNNNGYHDQASDSLWREGVKFGVKWQQEQDKNKYSEEEVYVILEKFKNLPLIQFQDWFEQFKNK